MFLYVCSEHRKEGELHSAGHGPWATRYAAELKLVALQVYDLAVACAVAEMLCAGGAVCFATAHCNAGLSETGD